MVVLLETRMDNSSGCDPVIPVQPRTHKYYPCSPFNWRLAPFVGSKTVGGWRPRRRLWRKKKKTVLTPLTHTHVHTDTDAKIPLQIPDGVFGICFLVVFFHDKKKKTTPKEHAFCILGYGTIQLPLRSWKDEYQVRHDSENFINKLMIAAWRTRKDKQKKVRHTAKMRYFGSGHNWQING